MQIINGWRRGLQWSLRLRFGMVISTMIGLIILKFRMVMMWFLGLKVFEKANLILVMH